MLVATWNVNGLRARLDYFLYWLKTRQPDLVALQEIKVVEDQFPFSSLEAEGYRVVVHGQKGWNGVAVLSRQEELEVLDRGFSEGEETGARLISVRAGNLRLVNVYCPNGKATSHSDFPRKLAWFERLRDFISSRHSSEDAVLLCGDFNICPAAIDSWDEANLQGTIFHTEEERSHFEHLIAWGFSDLYRWLHPERQAFSWWDFRAGAFHKNQGLRIDLMLATEKLRGDLTSIEIDREFRKKQLGHTPSDHAPVLAEFRR